MPHYVKEMLFSVRSTNILLKHGFSTLEDIAQYTASQLLGFHGLGVMTLQEIRKELKRHGLHLLNDPALEIPSQRDYQIAGKIAGEVLGVDNYQAVVKAIARVIDSRDRQWKEAILPDDPFNANLVESPKSASNYLRDMEDKMEELLRAEQTPAMKARMRLFFVSAAAKAREIALLARRARREVVGVLCNGLSTSGRGEIR